MTLCDFETVAYSEGVFTHGCRRCGIRRRTEAPRVFRTCSRPLVDASTMIRRINTCYHCTERPSGCWKTIDYDCTHKYHTAARQAAETRSCPLGKLP